SLPPFMLPWMMISGCWSSMDFELYRNGGVYDSFRITGWDCLNDPNDYTKEKKLSHLTRFRIFMWLTENGADKKIEEARAFEKQRKTIENTHNPGSS
ncbi:MAG: hypothetical protein KAU94_12930, partial [Verrucomicrobia bacterium]|nr:hypothetical protein [Verrucomicrobiota bacterium]